MNTEEKIEIMQAYLRGEAIEVSFKEAKNDIWIANCEPQWNWEKYIYRIKPATKPSINWDHVNENYNYLAVDNVNGACLFNKKPMRAPGYSIWIGNAKDEVSPTEATGFKSFNPGTVDWKDSLLSRNGD